MNGFLLHKHETEACESVFSAKSGFKCVDWVFENCKNGRKIILNELKFLSKQWLTNANANDH